VNTGNTELKYLAVSTKDSPGENLRFVVRAGQQTGYWDGE